MSNVVPFDTLALALALRDEAGFDQKQAEGTARVLSRLLVADLVTKADIAPLAEKADKADLIPLATKSDTEFRLSETRAGLEAKIAETRAGLEVKIAETRAGLEAKLADVRADLLKTIIGAVVVNSAVVVGAMFGLAKLLGH